MVTQIASKYGWTSSGAEPAHSYLVPATVQLLKKFSIASMLDIGTGNGSSLPAWQSQVECVAAMEPDEEGFNYARQYEGTDVRQLGVGHAVPEEWKNKFDCIVSLEVIEHLYNPLEMVKTCQQALKAGGIVIISTPYHGYVKNLAMAVFDLWDFHHDPIRTGGHIKFWTRRSLSDLFRKGGFKELHFQGVGRAPYIWKSMIMVFQAEKNIRI